jgi:ribosomal protein S18 acetylase RimI-like enzyme
MENISKMIDLIQTYHKHNNIRLLRNMKLNISFEPYASPEARAIVRDGVILNNVALTGLVEYYPLCILLRNNYQEIMGGIIGEIWAKSAYISYLWVSVSIRGQGHGSALLKAAESIATERSCSTVQLETFSFQSPDFYKKRGYEVMAVLSNLPLGYDKYFMMKTL